MLSAPYPTDEKYLFWHVLEGGFGGIKHTPRLFRDDPSFESQLVVTDEYWSESSERQLREIEKSS